METKGNEGKEAQAHNDTSKKEMSRSKKKRNME